MSYQALYRKWRPTGFDDVKGQDHIVTTLRNQIKLERIGHAYLFCGTRGTGKTTIAKIFAKAVNCEHPIDGNPCGECAVCKAIAAGSSMNVYEIDAASNNGVDNIRQIRDEVAYSPTEGRFKVYIIDEVHMLSMGAFNALLKTLEEPPAYVIFILATTEVNKIPITILSRCQRYDFHRIGIDTIAGRLKQLMEYENIQVEDRAVRYVAKAADGSMRDGLSLIDQCIAFYPNQTLTYDNVLEVLGAVDTDVFARALKSIVSSDVSDCMRLVEEIVMQGRELTQFVNDFVWYLRNMLLVKSSGDVKELEDIVDVSYDRLTQLKEDSGIIDIDTLMRYIRQLSELSNELKVSTQKRIRLEVAFVKLCKPAMGPSEDLSEMLGRISALEQQLEATKRAIEDGQLAVKTVAAPAREVAGAKDDAEARNVRLAELASADIDDLRQIAANWEDIVSTILASCDEIMIQTIFRERRCQATVAKDNKSLELVLANASVAAAFSDKDLETIRRCIGDVTGLDVNVVVTARPETDSFDNRFVDITELVNMNIEVEDKEEYI